MDLPPELLSVICSFLSKVELKAVRQVDHNFNQAAIPLLFNTVYISASQEDLDVSRLIGQRFGLYVKELVLVARYYEERTRRVHKILLDWQFLLNGLDGVTDQELEASYATHCAKRKEQEELLDNGEDDVHLRYASARMPNIQRVCISDVISGEFGAPTWTDFRKLRSGTYRDMLLHPAATPIFDFNFDSDQEGKQRAWRTLLIAIKAFSVGCHPIKHLSLCPADYRQFPIEALDQSQENLQHLANTFQCLETIHMGLSYYTEIFAADTISGQEKMARTLSTAKNLRHLFLHTDRSDWLPHLEGASSLSTVFCNCEFPMLNTLYLGSFRFHESNFASFLCRHSSTLKRLTIDRPLLDSGSWKGLLDCIRENLSLEFVKMTRLTNGFERPDGIEWTDCEGIQAFYSGNAGNAFAQEGWRFAVPKVERLNPLVGTMITRRSGSRVTELS